MLEKNNNYLKNKVINLVSISTKDRTIFTKLNSNDIFNPFIFYDKAPINSLYEANKVAKLSHKNDWSKLELQLTRINSLKEFISFIDSKSIFLPKNKVNLLSSSFSKNKPEILEYLKSKFELIDKKLANLDTMARARESDTGDWCFYLARYFLVGALSNKEVIKAPIFFKEVNIDLLTASLKSKEDTDLHINEKLIVHLIKQERKNANLLKEWNELTNIQDVINFLNANFDFDLELPKTKTDFVNEDMPDTKSRMRGKLVVDDTYILGFFQPRGGKLKQDLDHIIDIKADVFGDSQKTKLYDSKALVLNDETKWIQISSLNLSQLYALNLSLHGNTIIHGPPGTGKSETIANIIANIMMNNKSALMVSEKKAALDVLLDRLGPLKDFGMFFQDTKITKDKVIFYQTIQKLSDIYNNYNNLNPDFSYSEKGFKSLNKEKKHLHEAFLIMEEMKSWTIGDFDYNDYLETKFEILSEKIIEVVKEYKLHEISKIDFFSLTTLSLFLLKENELDAFETEKMMADMRRANDVFRKNLDELNDKWMQMSNYNIKTLPIAELIKIENSQPKISLLFQKYPNLIKMFDRDIFVYRNLEKEFAKLEEECVGLNIRHEDLIKMVENDNFLKILAEFKEASLLHKKYAVSKWFLEEDPTVKTKKHRFIFNWRGLVTFMEKLAKNKMSFLGFFVYLEHKKVLTPINVFFFKNGFIFEKHLTTFIENHWLKFNYIFPILIYFNDITYKKAQLATKVFAFEEKYNTNENVKMIEKYMLINNYIYNKAKVNWEIVIKEIYERLIISWKEKINNSEHKEDIMEIFRISNLKRFPKIKTFIKKYFDPLLEIFPIWISRPEDVADIIECKDKIFDYGIFDEASQMFLERAYPILYRTNIKIVAGDDKQLKPSSFFNTRYQEDEDDEDEEEEDVPKIKYSDLDSLLLRAIVSNWNEILLNNHYRSISQDLIEFSNKNIYDNKLNVATYNKSFDSKALQVINVNGFFVNRTNKTEANKALELIADNLFKYKKILIITFNESQSELITSKILSSNNKEMIAKMREAKIIITNLENVQGNEGDLVILSVAYGRPSEERRMRNSFGPLNMDGGKNRLNVAITRSKSKMIVLKSFSVDDMSVSSTNVNAQFFRDFILHCDQVSANIETEKKSMAPETRFENKLFDALEEHILKLPDLTLIPKYKIGTKRIDLAIFNSVTNKVVLGLELHQWRDGGNKDILEEHDKQIFVKMRGYNIFNIFEIDWRINKEKIILDVLEQIKLAK